MKKELLALILGNRHKLDGALKKKILIGIGVFSLFMFLVLGVLTYTAIKAGSYLIAKVPNQEQLSTIVQNVNQQSQKVAGGLVSVGCLDQINGLISINAWLTSSIAENVDKIIKSCLQFNFTNVNQQNNNKGIENDKNSI